MDLNAERCFVVFSLWDPYPSVASELLTFDGLLGVVDPGKFQAERTGHFWAVGLTYI